VNKILGGGLSRGHILEISGPPGSFKESLALDFVRTFAEADERIIFVGAHLMIPSTPGVLSRRARYARHDKSESHFRGARR
jgi:predicted ATP-dependent serine protease